MSTSLELASNPFALLSLIGAPAILTNAASLLALSTSNRFLRAGERLRAMVEKVEKATTVEDKKMWIVHMDRIERQAMLLLVGLRYIYAALGSFVLTSLVSIFGAALASHQAHPWDNLMMVMALIIGMIGAGAIVMGCISLFRATRLSLINIREEAAHVRKRERAAFSDMID